MKREAIGRRRRDHRPRTSANSRTRTSRRRCSACPACRSSVPARAASRQASRCVASAATSTKRSTTGGRISTATGGRSVDFSTVGADFVGSLTVMKTPDVTLSSSSIGATVNVAFPEAVRSAPACISSRARPARCRRRPAPSSRRCGVLFSDTFADDTMGILVDAIYTKHETDTNRVFVSGWEGGMFAPCQLTSTCAPADLADAEQDHRRLVAAAVRRRAIAGDRRAHRRSHRVPVASVGPHAAHDRRQFLAPENRDRTLTVSACGSASTICAACSSMTTAR